MKQNTTQEQAQTGSDSTKTLNASDTTIDCQYNEHQLSTWPVHTATTQAEHILSTTKGRQ
jgi:endonuclease/exonuclease/phosphatase (EEP) superfamily protein YafD